MERPRRPSASVRASTAFDAAACARPAARRFSRVLPLIIMAAFRLAMPLASPSPTPPPSTACNTPPTTTEIANPPELRSVNGVVSVTLTVAGDPNPANIEGMCWFYQLGGGAGTQWVPPTFHVKQGDRMVINLVND